VFSDMLCIGEGIGNLLKCGSMGQSNLKRKLKW
jgi:hypothetical protein